MPRNTVHKATTAHVHTRPDNTVYLHMEVLNVTNTSPQPTIIKHTARYANLEQAHQAAAAFLNISPRITKVYLLDSTNNVIAIVTRQANAAQEVN